MIWLNAITHDHDHHDHHDHHDYHHHHDHHNDDDDDYDKTGCSTGSLWRTTALFLLQTPCAPWVILIFKWCKMMMMMMKMMMMMMMLMMNMMMIFFTNTLCSLSYTHFQRLLDDDDDTSGLRDVSLQNFTIAQLLTNSFQCSQESFTVFLLVTPLHFSIHHVLQ